MSARSRTRGGLLRVSLLLALASGGAACDDDDVKNVGRGVPGKGGASAAASSDAPAKKKQKREAAVYRDDDFVESERNRDPFRSYVTVFRAKASDSVQRRVVMASTAIEEMKLIAIISGTSKPKAMLVDPMGTGHVVERGVYVGRPKVVLTRQDPTDPSRPPLTRIIPLHEEELASR